MAEASIPATRRCTARSPGGRRSAIADHFIEIGRVVASRRPHADPHRHHVQLDPQLKGDIPPPVGQADRTRQSQGSRGNSPTCQPVVPHRSCPFDLHGLHLRSGTASHPPAGPTAPGVPRGARIRLYHDRRGSPPIPGRKSLQDRSTVVVPGRSRRWTSQVVVPGVVTFGPIRGSAPPSWGRRQPNCHCRGRAMTTTEDQSSPRDGAGIDRLERLLERRGKIDDCSSRSTWRRGHLRGRPEPDDPAETPTSARTSSARSEGRRLQPGVAPYGRGEAARRSPPGLPIRRGRRPAEPVRVAVTGDRARMAISTGPRTGADGVRGRAGERHVHANCWRRCSPTSRPATPATVAGPVGRCHPVRHSMSVTRPGRPGWALQAVADQLAYDAGWYGARKRGIAVGSTRSTFQAGAGALEERSSPWGHLPLRAEPGRHRLTIRCRRRRCGGRARSARGSGG